MSALRLTGTLGCDARAYVNPDGSALLELQLHQGVNSLAAVARKFYGTGAAAQIAAHSAANHLRAGARVTVHAAGYDIRHRPTDHLVLLQVDHIEHQPVVQRAHAA
jgi:hypothetical protein